MGWFGRAASSAWTSSRSRPSTTSTRSRASRRDGWSRTWSGRSLGPVTSNASPAGPGSRGASPNGRGGQLRTLRQLRHRLQANPTLAGEAIPEQETGLQIQPRDLLLESWRRGHFSREAPPAETAAGQCLSFDPLPLEQDRRTATEVDVGRGEITQALVSAGVVVVLDKGTDLRLQIA